MQLSQLIINGNIITAMPNVVIGSFQFERKSSDLVNFIAVL